MERTKAPEAADIPPPPQRSADGRWWWDGQSWTLVAGAPSTGDQPEPVIDGVRADAQTRIPIYKPPSTLTGIPDPPAPLQLPLPPPPPPPPLGQDAAWERPTAFAGQHQPTTHAGTGRSLSRRTTAMVVAVILLATPIAYFTAGALNVAGDKTLAEQALQSGAGHTDQIADSLRSPNLPPDLAPTPQGFQTMRRALTEYGSRLGDVGSRLDSDIAALKFVDNSLTADLRNPLLWRDRSDLANKQRRVEALLAGLRSARSGLGILQGQVPAWLALFDVLESYQIVIPFLDRRDVNGALTHYSTLDQGMQALVASVRSSSFSPHFVSTVDHLKTLTADLKLLLEAVQYRNAEQVQLLLPKLQSDANALSKDDLADMDSFEQDLLLPYIDGYNSGLKAAGFSQVINPTRL